MGAAEAIFELRENKAVQIRPGGGTDWAKSRIEAAVGKYLQISHPLAGGRLMPLRTEQILETGFSHRDLFYTFQSPVLKISHKPLPVIMVLRPSSAELREVKRRNAPRVNALVPLSYEIGGAGLRASDHSLALSLSSTGLAFNAAHPISPRTPLGMEIHLPNATAGVSAKGEVVSCARVPHSREERYKIRVRFNALARSSAQRIAEFVRLKKEGLAGRGLE